MKDSSYTLKTVGSKIFTLVAVAGMGIVVMPLSSFAQVGAVSPQSPITQTTIGTDNTIVVEEGAEVPASELEVIKDIEPLIIGIINENTPAVELPKETNSHELVNDCAQDETLINNECVLNAPVTAAAVSAPIVTNTPISSTIPACVIGANLLENASFESPLVTSGGLYEMFSTVNNWIIKKVSDATPTVLEIHKGWSGNHAAEGAQYVELDANESTQISQAVLTTPGATYGLSWAFAGRHNIAAAQNQLSIKVDGSEVDTEGPVAANAGLISADWAHSRVEFVASASTTEIAFADAGPSDSYGTFLDDVQLCLIKEPAPVVPVVLACEINVISNDTNLVGGTNAVATYALNPGWLVKNLPSSLAEWIWGTYKVVDTSVDEEQTFIKTFNWNGLVTSAILNIAADNSYVVKLNGNVVGSDSSEKNFLTADQITLATSSINSGLNTLEITVKNFALAGSSPESNPAGLIYNLNIVGNNETLNCDEGPAITEPEPEVEEVVVTDPVVTTSNNSRRSGGGARLVRPQAQVEGITNTVLPAPIVLGEQVSIVPTGAPDAGHGGSANQSSLTISQLILAPKRLNTVK